MLKLCKLSHRLKQINSLNLVNRQKTINFENHSRTFVRFYSPKNRPSDSSGSSEVSSQNKKTFINFNEFITQRRDEANRSIVVQVNSEKSFPELYTYCCQFGDIVSAHHYRIPSDNCHYILIEFKTEQNAGTLLDSSQFNEENPGVPANSAFLWFRTAPQNQQKRKAIKKVSLTTTPLKLLAEYGNDLVTEEALMETVRGCSTFDDQILVLLRSTELNDIGTRLRFIAAKQMEISMHGIFPNARVYPFGSSVNGYGKMGCDLDLILRLSGGESEGLVRPEQKPYSRLIFHTKENLTNGRSQIQRQMECIGDMIHLFLPGVSHVRRILQARVPIIKYHHDHLDLEIDLSMNNLSGVYMSELLYMFGQLDDRVRPLIFFLKKWAQMTGLTNPSPGRWITNFSLTSLVIFFLQQLTKPVLPTINHLIQNATKDDVRITEDDINCTFVRDLNRITFKTQNTDSLEILLLKFFEYYSQFDFFNKGLSLNEGKVILKPDHSAMYIVNPLEIHLNVSKNVSLEEAERFRIEVRNAAWLMESTPKNSSNWGILNLLKINQTQVIKPNMFYKPRMFEVSELFDADEEQRHSEMDSNGTNEVEYKNQSVRHQVNSIRAKGRSDLKQLKEMIFTSTTKR